VLIIATFFIMSFVMWIIDKLDHLFDHNHSATYSLSTSMWFATSTFLQQGADVLPLQISLRILSIGRRVQVQFLFINQNYIWTTWGSPQKPEKPETF
jgi:hypothetical protein